MTLHFQALPLALHRRLARQPVPAHGPGPLRHHLPLHAAAGLHRQHGARVEEPPSPRLPLRNQRHLRRGQLQHRRVPELHERLLQALERAQTAQAAQHAAHLGVHHQSARLGRDHRRVEGSRPPGQECSRARGGRWPEQRVARVHPRHQPDDQVLQRADRSCVPLPASAASRRGNCWQTVPTTLDPTDGRFAPHDARSWRQRRYFDDFVVQDEGRKVSEENLSLILLNVKSIGYLLIQY